MLGENIKNLRTIKGLSQVELAKLLCVTKQSVSNWENENIQPSIDMLIKLADVFSVSTDYLLDREINRNLDCKKLTAQELSHVQEIINDICKSR